MAKTLLIALALAILPGSVGRVELRAASQNTPIARAQKQAPDKPEPGQKSVEGEFTKVDNTKHLLWIKTTEGREMQFTYTDQTPVIGSGKTVELGSKLKVYYEEKGETMAALRIEVQQEQG